MPRLRDVFAIIFYFGLCSSTLCAEESAETYQLRYAFQQGEFVKYLTTDQSTFTSRKAGFQETNYNSSSQWRHFRVVTVQENGDASLELMIDRVRMMSQFDDHPATIFDSAEPAQQPAKMKSILNSIGKPMTRITVNTRGELLDIHNLDGTSPKETDPAKNFLVVFPEEAIAVGDTWKQTLEIEVPVTRKLKQNVNLLRRYTLTSVEDEIATISLNTIVTTPIRDPAVKTRLIQQTPSGTIQFDLKKQLIVSRDWKVDDQVIGAFGPETLVQATSKRSEKLLTPDKPDGEIQQASATVEEKPAEQEN